MGDVLNPDLERVARRHRLPLLDERSDHLIAEFPEIDEGNQVLRVLVAVAEIDLSKPEPGESVQAEHDDRVDLGPVPLDDPDVGDLREGRLEIQGDAGA